MVSAEGEALDADRREPTMTLTGWRRFVDSPPASFGLLAGEQWQALSGEQRGRYDQARLATTPSWWSWPPRRCGRWPGRAAADLAEPAGDLRPARADRVRPAGHGQEHRAEAAGPHPRAHGAGTLPGHRPDPGGLRDHAAERIAAEADEFARFLGLPPVRRGQNTTDIADAVARF